VLADLRGVEQADVGDAAAHRPQHRDRRPAHGAALDGDHAGRWTKAHDAAERGGIAQAAPVSEPVQTGSMSVASAAAEPPDEAAGIEQRIERLPVAPHTGLRLFEPAPNSGTLVLPTTTAPARARGRP